MNPALPIYLDNNATTACAPEVLAAMLPYLGEACGNPSSTHYAGRQARRAVEVARAQLAELLGARSHELFFNSGATEGNNWIFQSILKSSPARRRLVVSSIEHKSVLLAARSMTAHGYEVVELPVTPEGVVDMKAASQLINSDTLLVAVQFANNETGVIQPIAELGELAHVHGAIVHCDAVQGLGKAWLNLAELPIDSACASAHKIHGPKGVGALYLRRGVQQWPLAIPLCGGGQERQVRPGTHNVPGIVGFGTATKLIQEKQAMHMAHMRNLQDLLERELKQRLPTCVIHGETASRICNTTNVAIPGIPADILMANLPDFCVSSGSACNSGAIGASYVLEAMSVPLSLAKSSIRISLSKNTTQNEISAFIEELHMIKQSLLNLVNL